MRKHIQILPLRPKQIERFWKRVTILGPDDCWLWRGPKNAAGYGQYNVYDKGRTNRRAILTHRVVLALRDGEPPPGLIVRHQCHTPLCCNPSHLLLGTHQDNYDDMVRAGREPEKVLGDYVRGVFSANHPASDYTDEHRESALRMRFIEHRPMTEIAGIIGCNRITVGRWCAEYLGRDSYDGKPLARSIAGERTEYELRVRAEIEQANTGG